MSLVTLICICKLSRKRFSILSKLLFAMGQPERLKVYISNLELVGR